MVSSTAGTLRVVYAGAAARRAGIRGGDTLAEACALLPGLEVHEEDPAGDRRCLEELAAWAVCLSPVVHLEGVDTLLVDVTGCARLFGGEERLLERAAEGLAEQGWSVAAAIADTPGAAWALAHSGHDARYVSPPGQAVASLAALPVRALRIDPQVAAELETVGVRKVETLLHLPRSGLQRRFGEDLLLRLDQATGEVIELLEAYRPASPVRARVGFAAATAGLEVLHLAIERALGVFCRQLEERAAGVRRLDMVLHYARCGCDRIEVFLSRATRSRQRLGMLLKTRLEGVRLHRPVVALQLEAAALEPLDVVQQEWFAGAAPGAAALADLVDCLAVRLGAEAVARARPVDAHLPELAYRYESLSAAGGWSGTWNGGRAGNGSDAGTAADPGGSWGADGGIGWGTDAVICRPEVPPLRLLAAPVRVEVVVAVADGPPARFRFAGRDHRVRRWAGPQRLETGWWAGRDVRRDYYRVESDQGCRYWIFRAGDTSAWFVHGVFD